MPLMLSHETQEDQIHRFELQAEGGFQFSKVTGKLSDYGYNCIKLADDWQGVDFLAYHKDGSGTLKVQLKARLALSKSMSGNRSTWHFRCTRSGI